MVRRFVVSLPLVALIVLLAAAPVWAAEVVVGNNGLDPALVQADVGESIVWINASDQELVLASDDPLWTSGPLAPGESFSLTYDEAGTFPYASADGSVQGQIVVGGEGAQDPVEPPDGGGEAPIGAPAELPATGSNAGLAVLAFGMITSGSLFVAAGRPRPVTLTPGHRPLNE
jgi:plastocyanin